MSIYTNTEFVRQLDFLGNKGKVHFQAVLPKRLDVATAKKLGLTFRRKGSINDELSRPGFYLEAGQLYQKFGEKSSAVKADKLAVLNDQGFGIYMVINEGGNANDDITSAATLYYECDHISKDEQWGRLRKLEGKLGAQASMVIETANSLHVYFKLDEPCTDMKKWVEMQTRLILEQDSDPAIKNPARIMRVAGMDHKKWDVETQTFVSTPVRIRQESGNTFSLEQLDRILPLMSLPEVKAPNPSRKVNGFNLSMLDLAEYLEGYDYNGRIGFATMKCPGHNGDSFNSLHVAHTTGAFKCHGGCKATDVWKASVAAAISFDPSLKDTIYKAGTPFDKEKFLASANAVYKASSGLVKYVADIVVNQQNLELPDDGFKGITFVSSACKTGKTQAASDKIKPWVAAGGVVRVVAHRNALVRQICTRVGAKHIQDYDKNELAINASPAVGLCPDSIKWLSLGKVTPGTLVFVDECNAVGEHVIEGATLGDEHEKTIEKLKNYLRWVWQKKGEFLLMEADLTDWTIDFWRQMIGESVPYRIIVNEAQKSHWNVTIAGGSRGEFTNNIVRDLAAGKQLVVVADSQKYGNQLEMMLKMNGDKYKVLRVDSTTSDLPHIREFMTRPDEHLSRHYYDMIILSPTAESGLSFWLKGIHKVYGMFVRSTTRQAIQMLERYRLDCDRVIFCQPVAVGARKNVDAPGLLAEYAFLAQDAIERTNVLDRIIKDANAANERLEHNEAYLNYTRQSENEDGKIFNELHARCVAAEMASKVAMQANLIAALQEHGHNVTVLEKWAGDSAITEAMAAAKDQIVEDAAIEVIEADATKNTPEMARTKLKSHSISHQERVDCTKTLYVDRLPGYDLSDLDSVKFLVEKDGKNYTHAQRRFYLEHPELARAKDQFAIARRYDNSGFIMLHTIPKTSQQTDLMVPLRRFVNELKGCQWYNHHPVVQALSGLLVDNRETFKKVTGLTFEELRPQVKDEHGKVICQAVTECTNVNKLMKWFGYTPKKSARLGAADNRHRIYEVDDKNSEYRAQMDKAMLVKNADKIAETQAQRAMSTELDKKGLVIEKRGHGFQNGANRGSKSQNSASPTPQNFNPDRDLIKV